MIKAVIFDMDGVIIDSEQYHLDAYNQTLKKFNIQFTAKQFKNLFGRGSKQILTEKFKELNIHENPITYAKIKDMAYRKLISTNLIPLPGAINLINVLKGRLKICVASSSSKKNVRLILSRLNILKYLDFCLTGDDVADTKPSPEIYAKAVTKLCLRPEECVVIEDSDLGIQSAKIAGTNVIAVKTTLPQSRLNKADLIIDTLEQLNYGMILSLGKCNK